MPKQLLNTHSIATARRWLLAAVGGSSLLLGLIVAPVPAGAEAATSSNASTTQSTATPKTKNTPKTKKTKAIVLTKWQKEEVLLSRYNAKKKLSVTKHHKKIAKLYAKHYMYKKYKKNSKAHAQYKCFVHVVKYESNWNWKAKNSRGYYGLPQTKHSMKKFGKNWKHHYKPQVQWAHSYMKKRYGSPCGAWKKIKHSGWY